MCCFPSADSNPPCRSQRAVGEAPVHQECIEGEREETVVSPWTLPSEIHRILHDRSGSLPQVTAAPHSAVVFVCTCLLCLRQDLTASVGFCLVFFIFFQPVINFQYFLVPSSLSQNKYHGPFVVLSGILCPLGLSDFTIPWSLFISLLFCFF